MLLNLRAKGDPDQVQRLIAAELHALDGSAMDIRLDCFSPAPPKPERRITPASAAINRRSEV